MGREQERIRRELENNPIVECNKVRQRYCPSLFQDFTDTKDPQNLSYTDYSNKGLLGTVFYKGIAGITSMQSRSMTTLRGWTLMNCRKYSRNRFTD